MKHFLYLLEKFWFIPSDVLLRSVEAELWEKYTFRSRVLEIGIGDGKMSSYLFKSHQKIDVGIDVNKEYLSQAQKTKKYKRVILANAEHLPFKDPSFYSVISNSTFEHIQNDKKAVTEVSRVLKKSGRLFITVPSVYLKQWIPSENLKQFNQRVEHFHYRSIAEWEKILTENHLKIIFHTYYFPKEITLLWYKLFSMCTYKIGKRELWSYLGHSKFTRYIPKKIVISILKKMLHRAFEKALTNQEKGSMLFIVSEKL